jgi:predicted component of type VI protein secretion system
MTIKKHPMNDSVREAVAVAVKAADGRRNSQYLKDALAQAKTQLTGIKAALQRANDVLNLPEGHPGRLGAVTPAQDDVAKYKEALADAADIQFGLENYIAGKNES